MEGTEGKEGKEGICGQNRKVGHVRNVEIVEICQNTGKSTTGNGRWVRLKQHSMNPRDSLPPPADRRAPSTRLSNIQNIIL